MRILYRFLYSVFFINFLRIGFLISSLFNKKIRTGLLGRIGLWKRYNKAFLCNKTSKKRIWFHVSSMGELEQAKPLMQLISERLSDNYEIILTYFSPTAKKYAERLSYIKYCDYLPLDTYLNTKLLFHYIKPSMIVFVKFDIWPNIIFESKNKKIPSMLIDATLHRASLRYSNFFGQSFYNSINRCFDLIATVSENDFNRFKITSPKHPNIKVAGDTRYDQVAVRAGGNRLNSPLLYELKKHKTIICGSTWGPDLKNILNPLKKLMEEENDLYLVLVPHEPNSSNINLLKNEFSKYSPTLFTDVEKGNVQSIARVMIVDTVGTLAEIYKFGFFAYIGGAFTTGVHNVMEPAIMGLPVSFGTFYFNSPEAERLIELGCAFSGSNEEDFYSIFKTRISNAEETIKLGEIAKNYIYKNLGAAQKCYEYMTNLLE